MKKGALCISLDFEKYWGVHDLLQPNSSIVTFDNVQTIVNRLLDLFKKYNIHCTWATIGMLNFDNVEALETATDKINISYLQKNFGPYPISKHNLGAFNKGSFLGQAEIEKIKNQNGQELASHTFSHYYCLEDGQSENDFIIDLHLFEKHVGEVKSIVFPRNQINQEYLNICSQHGISAFRGNQENWFWKNSQHKSESFLKKLSRTADAYLPISNSKGSSWKTLGQLQNNLINIPANRFYRAYKYGKAIEQLKLRRIKKELLKAAKSNRIYHLWWHPHNFLLHPDQNFDQLEQLFKYVDELRKNYGFKSLNMNDITQIID
ncbi:MAG: polysaccharide deacetylase family protein [Crocinitomicaceae bacterium]